MVMGASLAAKNILKDLGFKLLLQIECNRIEHLMNVLQALQPESRPSGATGFVLVRATDIAGSSLTQGTDYLQLNTVNLTCVLIECSMIIPDGFYELLNSLRYKIKLVAVSFNAKKVCLGWLESQLHSIGLVARGHFPNDAPRFFWNKCGGSLPCVTFELLKASTRSIRHRLSPQRAHKLLQPLPVFVIKVLRRALEEQNIVALLLFFSNLKSQHRCKAFFNIASEIIMLLKTVLESNINSSGDLIDAGALEYVSVSVSMIHLDLIAECDENFVWSLLMCASVIILLRAPFLLSGSCCAAGSI